MFKPALGLEVRFPALKFLLLHSLVGVLPNSLGSKIDACVEFCSYILCFVEGKVSASTPVTPNSLTVTGLPGFQWWLPEGDLPSWK